MNWFISRPIEIDILEYLINDPYTLITNYHYGQQNIDQGKHYQTHGVTNLEDDFQIYTLDWTEDYIAWYIDGRLLTIFTNKARIAEAQNQYLLINIAVGGWADDPDETTQWTAYYDCDCIRVWKRK